MALAFGNFQRKFPVKGGYRSGYVDITLDNSYPTGGWAITAANLGIGTIHNLIPPAFKSGFGFDWDHTNKKLRAWFPTQQTGASGNRAGVEVDNTNSSLNTLVLRCYYEGY